ncbi:MAG: BamA/TamA family outer membrane protein [Tidjanibacter sp.]|nr:BamA/TamA family outer membrane protein [Tidjanibacter sp.]
MKRRGINRGENRRSLLGVAALLAVFVLGGCNTTRNLPQGSYQLEHNRVVIDKSVPKEERITKQDISRYITQKPATDLFGVRGWLYSKADTTSGSWWDKLLRNIGTAPVILDTTLTERSVERIESFMDWRGYFESDESYSIRLDSVRQRARVTYAVEQGEPYRIASLEYDFRDPFVGNIIMEDSASLLKVGNVLDMEALSQERVRIAERLRNMGYYNFSVDNIHFPVDTTIGNHLANVTMVVNQYTTGYNAQGMPVQENNALYRIGEINVFPDYDAQQAAIDPTYFDRVDTLHYEGLNILYHDELTIRPEVLRRVISIYPGYLYSEDEINRTYDNLMSLSYFKSASVVFTPMESDIRNVVTYIGDDNSGEVIETYEDYLSCSVRCTPTTRQGYTVELEASTTSSFYGLSTSFGYQNRNLFKGAELFEADFTFAYEMLKVKTSRNSFEVGGSVALNVPRFMTPFPIDRIQRTLDPQTRFEASYNTQRRPYYHRSLLSGAFGYSWGGGEYSTYTLRPIDISLVKMNYVSEDFLNRLQNPYLRNSYTSQMIAGMSGAYLYDRQSGSRRSSSTFRLGWETSGNLLNGLEHIVGHKEENEDFYRLFGIRYAQYIRLDASWARSIPVGEQSALAYRLYGGYGYSYGNGKNMSIPFDRLFYAGGINSMRGWPVRTLGPGSSLAPEDVLYPSQLGNMRLEANLEWRFPMSKMVDGALFFDLGNIWNVGRGNYEEESMFQFNNLPQQLGFNTGFGIRFDLNVTILRLDWGIRLHDPNLPAGERWIKDFRLKNTALNFGIGYPF